MKARTLNRLFPNLRSRAMLEFERQMVTAFEEVLAEAGRRAVERFHAKAHPHTLAASAPTPASSMVAVYPSDEEAVSLAQAGGEPPEQIHCTLAFLGELDPDQAEAAAAVVQKVAREHEPMVGEVGGVACFDDNGSGYPSLVLPDVHRLAELRHAVCEALDAAGVPRATNHGWTPHLTIAYGEELATPPSHLLRHPLTFAEVSFAQGDRRRDFELSSGRLASASFALGEALPEVFVVDLESDTEREIARVAAEHQPDEPGYGATAYNAETGKVLWVSWDGSSSEEIEAVEAAMLAIKGVGSFDYEAESLPDGWWDAKVVYPESPPRWVVEPSLTAAGPPADWAQPHADELVDVDALVGQFRERAEPVRTTAVEAIATPALDRAGLSFDATNRFVTAVTGRVGQHITSIADTTRLNVMRIVRTSYEAGLSIPDTAAAIQEGMAAASSVRASLIARTEMVGLVNGGSLAAMRIVDDSLQQDADADPEAEYAGFSKRWLTAPGASDPRHETYEGLDGQTVPLDAFFQVGADELEYCGDPAGSPEEVCNCRCTVIYVDGSGEETDDAEVTAALTFRDEVDEGGNTVRVGQKIERGDALVAGASGSTSLPLSDRDAEWNPGDANGAGADASFWHDPDGPTFDLGFARNTSGDLTAIWAGVVACAGAAQGPRAGFEIPESDILAVRRNIEAYYAKAREVYADDAIRAPWDDSADAETAAHRLAYAELGESESLAYAERLAYWEGYLAEGGGLLAPEEARPQVFVRIRPDFTEFRTELETGVREIVSGLNLANASGRTTLELAPMPVDVRPESTTPEIEIETPAERTNASQIPWKAILAPEGKVTDDGRIFAPGSITWRDLPLSLMAMTITSEGGHIGAELAGRIDRIWRDDTVTPTLIRAEGVFSDSEYGAKIAALVGERELRGNSVDLAVRAVEIGPRSDYVDENGYWKADAVLGADRDPAEILFEEEEPLVVFTDAVIGMSTVCPFPAFEEGEIMLAAADDPTPEFGIASDKTGLRLTIWLRDAVEAGGEVITASAAGYAPIHPPAEWFENPELEELTALTVTDDGRVFGHAWAWDVCHIGIPGTCTTAPHSETDYAMFLLKEVECDDGTVVRVGTITLGTGHAGRTLGQEAAADHYDNTGTAIVDVTIGEDEFGGWIAGALRPDVPAARAREFRGSVLSGDWRRVDGNLELVALLAVNVPGFPVPRAKAAVVASAGPDEVIEVLALTAAGVVLPLEPTDVPADRAKLTALAARARGGLVALAELAAEPFEAPAPRSKPERLTAALTAAGEAVDGVGLPVTTYELTQGSLAARKFYAAAIEAAFSEVTAASWPSDAELVDPGGEVLFRQGNDGVYRLPDGSIVLASVEDGWAVFKVAAPSRQAGAETLAAFGVEYPPLYRQATETTQVPITFWTLSPYGPQRRLRLIDSASWSEIERNYTGEVRDELERLMGDTFEPGKNGQLLIWTGPPGTGKTWALRALATEWADWAEFSFITDPDAFFVKDPSYMIDVLLHDAYESLTVEGDLVTDNAGEKWRILILEDTGELLSANAKQESGQGLSRLLNVVDGMVGQGLRVLAIVTTNDEIEGFHPAVTRPGRCASQIAFGALSAEEAAEWLETETAEPMTLAELYAAAGVDALAEEAAEPMPCANCDHAFDAHPDGGACSIEDCDCMSYAEEDLAVSLEQADDELAAGGTKPLGEVLDEIEAEEAVRLIAAD